MNSVFKPAVILMAGRAVGFAINFITPLIMVRIFDQSEFGTYKQLFLLYTTLFGIAQVGMAEGLYYFLPFSPERAGAYVTTSLLALAASGAFALALLGAAADHIGGWLSNPAVPQYLFILGLYLWFTLISTPLEIVLISRQRFLRASAAYALTDILRTILMVLPALLGWGLRGVMWGAAATGLVRMAATVAYAMAEFRAELKVNLQALRSQLVYAVPFALWVVVEMANTTLPQYLVAHKFDAATFAIFSVGCLQVPLVDFILASTGSVMMVKIGLALRERRTAELLVLWHETNLKLALMFVPIVTLLILVSRELIVFLFTASYEPSARLFAIWCILMVLAAIPVEGVLRTFADTGVLLLFSAVKFLIIAGLSLWSLGRFGLSGVIVVAVVANAVYKTLGLWRFKKRAGITVGQLLPWPGLARVAGSALLSAAAAWIVKTTLTLPNGAVLVATGATYMVSYAALAHRFGLIDFRDIAAAVMSRLPFRPSGVIAEAELP